MTSLTKNPHLPTKKNFFRVQASRLAESFELLTRSVALTGPEKFLRKATCVSVFFLKSLISARRQSVNADVFYVLNVSYLTDIFVFIVLCI